MSTTITIVGARGGQGTSTVAAAFAISTAEDRPTTLLAHDLSAMVSLLGLPSATRPPVEVARGLCLAGADGPGAQVTVLDAGTVAGAAPGRQGFRYAVVRGPCYLSLATLVSHRDVHLDGVVLLSEAGRALGVSDVSAVLGVPVVAQIPVTSRVARALDAGLLVSRLERLSEFCALRSLARSTEATVEAPAAPRDRARGALGFDENRRLRSGRGDCVGWEATP